VLGLVGLDTLRVRVDVLHRLEREIDLLARQGRGQLEGDLLPGAVAHRDPGQRRYEHEPRIFGDERDSRLLRPQVAA
jgi:hypothetical protein